MVDRIGEAAGEIWKCLEGDAESASPEELRRKTKLPKDLVLMGLGWLAREEKLSFTGAATTLRVALRR